MTETHSFLLPTTAGSAAPAPHRWARDRAIRDTLRHLGYPAGLAGSWSLHGDSN